MGLEPHVPRRRARGYELLAKNSYDLCPRTCGCRGDGLAVVDHVAKHHPAAGGCDHGVQQHENAVAALKAGAFDYLSKPVSLNQLRDLVRSALKLPQPNQGRRGNEAHEAAPGGPVLVGSSSQMQATREMIEKLARSQAPIHVTGESGSGKELAARLIHLKGARRDGPSWPSTGAPSDPC